MERVPYRSTSHRYSPKLIDVRRGKQQIYNLEDTVRITPQPRDLRADSYSSISLGKIGQRDLLLALSDAIVVLD